MNPTPDEMKELHDRTAVGSSSVLVNLQPAEKPWFDANGELDVVEVWPTIQGEGPFAGRPAVFVRLAGCNLQCPRCDTDYTTNRQVYSSEALCSVVRQLKNNINSFLVVITGGEPFRQNIGQFVRDLTSYGMRVQIETNGTLKPDGFPYYSDQVSIVMSPKTPSVVPAFWDVVTCVKYVLQAGKVDADGLPFDVLGSGHRPARPPRGYPRQSIYVQPLDEGDEERNRANVRATVESAMKFGYTVSLQTHKILQVR